MAEALPRNIRAFLAFRVCFNARFYYPVLSVLFVDLGLTLAQYSWLNVAWAVSIVLCELPLGIVADRIGRKPLVVGAACLMMFEMAVLAFARGDPDLLFVLFLINRMLSGLAEAAASGADEALAYDSLAEQGRAGEWQRVLTRLQTWMSLAFVVAMVVGAFSYDAAFLNGIFGTSFTAEQSVRFPVYLTLALSFGALAAAVVMREPEVKEPSESSALGGLRIVLMFIRKTPLVLAVVLFALVMDTAVRMFMTLQSNYFRLVSIPEAAFGVIGAGFAGLGLLSPPLAKRLLRTCSPRRAYAILAVVTAISLTGIALIQNWLGVVAALPMIVVFNVATFISSEYLNSSTPQSMRATVLSVKSLAANLSYGAAGMIYAAAFRIAAGGDVDSVSPEADAAFESTLNGFPIAFLLMAIPLLIWSKAIPKMCVAPSAK